ncbi:transposase, MuDR, MULE transposase domain protein [Tanacetum coccineum]
MNESSYKNEPHFTKPESSFAFGSSDENKDEQNDCNDGINENPQPIYHKWKKFMSFKPDISKTPVYKSKPMISKHYNKESEVKQNNIFNNKEALDLVIRLKSLNDGFYYLSNKSAPKRKNQGTVTHIKTNEQGVFEMLFIAIGSSIRTFLNYLRPLLIIDEAHLKGLYKGTNLVAVSMDGNNQIVSIAFECIGDNPNLLFISDRHSSIALALHNEFPLAFHVDVQPDAYHKLCQAGPQRWSRVHCPLVCYNYMTLNSVKSVNACTELKRKLPVTMLAETYHAMVQDWYFKHRELAANMTYEITDWVAEKVHKRKLKSAVWIVRGVNQYQYQVSDGRFNREVNFETSTYECRKWQLSGIPCGHVIAVTRFVGLTDCVQFVADWFKKDKYQGPYTKSIHFVGNMQEWEFLHHIQKVITPRMDNLQLGRPKNTNRIPSQGEEPRVIHCSRCNQAGNKRDQCNKPFVPEPPIKHT